MMQRALKWLNLYGREAVRHMLQNGLKHKKCILTFSEKALKIYKIFTVNLTVCSNRQINGEGFLNFCGLLGKHEL